MSGKLRVTIGQFGSLTPEIAAFAKQLGFDGIQMNTPDIPGEELWTYEDLLDLRLRCEAYGLRFEMIENVPYRFMRRVLLGLDGREEEIERYRTMIRNVGKAGIPVLGHHFMPDGTWRTSYTVPLRGNARGMGFDLRLVKTSEPDRTGNLVIARDPAFKAEIDRLADRTVGEDEMWERYGTFIKGVLPAAEEAGVRLALHPDDPPVGMLGGFARLFSSVDGLKRAMDLADSEAWGVNLCLGTVSSMAGGAANVREAIEYFGSRGRIFAVHFRDVQGTAPSFNECFLGDGNFEPVEAMRMLRRVGYKGIMIDDHVPWIDYDTDWGHRSHAHQSGYLQGILAALEVLEPDPLESRPGVLIREGSIG